MTATLTAPEVTTDTLEHLDFAPSCHVYSKTKDDRCDEPSVAYVEVHKIGACRSDEANGAGNMEGNVCQEHLDFFTGLAAQLSSGQIQIICQTCGLAIDKPSDVLQKVIRL